MRFLWVPLVFGWVSFAHAESGDLLAFQRQAESRAQSQLASLLKELCPEQCVLLSVRAEVSEEAVFSRDPGFEEVVVEPPAPKVKEVAIRLLVSETLSASFREKLKTAAEARLMEKVELILETVAFPPKMPAAAPPGPVWPSPPPMAWGAPSKADVAPGPSEGPTTALAWPWMVFAAVLGGLLVLVLLVLVVSLRRPIQVSSMGAPAPQVKEEGPAHTVPTGDRAKKAWMKQLRRHGAAVSALVRRALQSGEHDRVAEWVAAAGDWVLKDALNEPHLRGQLSGMIQSMAKRAPLDSSRQEQVLQQLASEALAEHLRRATHAHLEQFEFLEGIEPSAIAKALSDMPVAKGDLVLQSVSPTLRNALFRHLPAPVTQALARYWMNPNESLNPEQIQRLAESLRQSLPAVKPELSVEQLHPLLDALTLEQQTQMLETLRAEGPLPSTLLAEIEMIQLEKSILASALLTIPLTQLACYLRFAEPSVAETMTSVLPGRVREELNEEIRVMSGASQDQREASRSEVLRAIRQQSSRAGAST